MPIEAAETLAQWLAGIGDTPEVRRIVDQLWLRTILIDRWRRARLAERPAFETRADRLLAALDPSPPDRAF